jgi:suppressor of G2 allele of SKP1
LFTIDLKDFFSMINVRNSFWMFQKDELKKKERREGMAAEKKKQENPRYDFSQTSTHVHLDIYLKEACQVSSSVVQDGQQLSINLTPQGFQYDFLLQHAIQDTLEVEQTSFKIHFSLVKKEPGVHWPTFFKDVPKEAPRKKMDWDSIKDEDEDKQSGDLQDLFGKIYKDADDNARRAMNKSYTESGGTALSTDWKDVQRPDYAQTLSSKK